VITTIGIDADDTLWHNDNLFTVTYQRFFQLLAPYAEQDHLQERMMAAERRNLSLYGYGVKGFTLSMIETAIEVMDRNAPVNVIGEILTAGKAMLERPVETFEGVQETIAELAKDYTLVLITKGDLLDQERKLASSGLGEFFDAVETATEKTPELYARIFSRQPGGVAGAAMVGDALTSDILPAIAAGAWGIHIPYATTFWAEESAVPMDTTRYIRLDKLAALPAWLRGQSGGG
jgi:putative hydrolase of the HAD superfamily